MLRSEESSSRCLNITSYLSNSKSSSVGSGTSSSTSTSSSIGYYSVVVVTVVSVSLVSSLSDLCSLSFIAGSSSFWAVSAATARALALYYFRFFLFALAFLVCSSVISFFSYVSVYVNFSSSSVSLGSIYSGTGFSMGMDGAFSSLGCLSLAVLILLTSGISAPELNLFFISLTLNSVKSESFILD